MTKPMLKASDLLYEVEKFLIEVDSINTNYPHEKQKLYTAITSFLAYKEKVFNLKKVLDHGFVRLVDYMGNDLSIVRAARVSYNADWRSTHDDNKDEKLISYLLRNKHTSPFESVVFTFEIKCPIFVLRQWGRHRTQDYNDGAGIGYEKFWSYNEVSARYTELPEEFYIPDPEVIGKQSKDNKQARDLNIIDDKSQELTNAKTNCLLIRDTCEESFRTYRALLARGVPRELARSVLPVATYTRLFATVNLHNLLLWAGLRIHPHAQYEIRVYAQAVIDIISHIVPVTMNTWAALRLEEEAKKHG